MLRGFLWVSFNFFGTGVFGHEISDGRKGGGPPRLQQLHIYGRAYACTSGSIVLPRGMQKLVLCGISLISFGVWI